MQQTSIEQVNQELALVFGEQSLDLPFMWEVDVELDLGLEDKPTVTIDRDQLYFLKVESKVGLLVDLIKEAA